MKEEKIPGKAVERKAPSEGAMAPTVYLGEQRLSPEDTRLREEAYSRLELWEQENRKYHDLARKCRLIYRLQDPDQDPPGTPPEERALQLQTLKSTINNCVADQIDNLPEAFLLPQRPELQAVAGEMTNVVKFIVEQNDGKEFFRRRDEDFMIAGTSVTQIMWDEDMDNGHGNVAMLNAPIESIVWDPMARDIQQGRALIKLTWYPLSWFAEHYPEQAAYIGDESNEHNNAGMPSTMAGLVDETEGRAMLMEYWYRRYNAKKRHYTINVAYFAGGALLRKYEDVYAHGMYPFVFDVYSQIDGQPVGESMVSELAAMMRYINRYAHYIDVNVRYSAKARILSRKNNGINPRELADWSNNIIEGDSVSQEDVRWLETKPLSSMASQQMLQFQSDMKMDSGQNQFSRGEVSGGVTAASAISALQEAGGKITRMRTNILSAGFKKIVEQILWLVSEFYTDERTALVVGEDFQPMPIMLNADHLMGERRKAGSLQPPPYTVSIQIQRSNPMRVQAQNDLFLQAYSMSAQSGQNFPLSVLFEMLNVDGKDRILPILQRVEQTTQMMQQLQMQNEQLTQQNEGLQTALDSYAQSLSTDVGEIEEQSFGGLGQTM